MSLGKVLKYFWSCSFLVCKEIIPRPILFDYCGTKVCVFHEDSKFALYTDVTNLQNLVQSWNSAIAEFVEWLNETICRYQLAHSNLHNTVLSPCSWRKISINYLKQWISFINRVKRVIFFRVFKWHGKFNHTSQFWNFY